MILLMKSPEYEVTLHFDTQEIRVLAVNCLIKAIVSELETKGLFIQVYHRESEIYFSERGCEIQPPQ